MQASLVGMEVTVQLPNTTTRAHVQKNSLVEIVDKVGMQFIDYKCSKLSMRNNWFKTNYSLHLLPP